MHDMKSTLRNLSPQEKMTLTSGHDFWTSEPLYSQDIPSFRMSDGPHGLRYQAQASDHLGINQSVPSTSFPTASASACTWDKALLAQMGQAIAKEAQSLKVDMVLGPGINIKRNPLCGRNFEYFSEDPYLSGQLGAAWIKGLQGQGVAACLKHFACNNQENDRLLSDSLVDPIALHELYLEAFRIAIKASQPESIMCAYNKINGTYASDNYYLLTQILRRQWGFKGAVITDWGALNNKVNALNAGTDLEMPSSSHMFDQAALADLKTGALSAKALDRAARHVITLARKSRPKFNGDRAALLAQNAGLAQKIAENAIVLLKNTAGILPLQPTDKLLVVGEMAQHTRYQGAGSSHINPPSTVNILEGLTAENRQFDYEIGYRFDNQQTHTLAQAASQSARQADKVILVLGLPEVAESEGFDRTSLDLPANQNALVPQLAKANPNLIVLLVAGAPVTLSWLDKVKGLLNLYLGGQNVGQACARILTGQVNPSGKLAETYPIAYQDVPSAKIYDHNTRSVAYEESLYVGYRYFDKANMAVNFPFGFGLSYTTFALSNLHSNTPHIAPGQELNLSVTVTNTGTVAGQEVVQVYVGADPRAPLTPLTALKAFQKVALAPGASQTLTFTLSAQAFMQWDPDTEQWQLPKGSRRLYVGTSSRDLPLETIVTLDGTTPGRSQALPQWYSTPAGYPNATDFELLSNLRARPMAPTPVGAFTPMNTPRELSENSIPVRQVTNLIRHYQTKDMADPKGSEAQFMDKIILDTPLIRLSQQTQGQFSLAMLKRLVALANHKYWRALIGK
ncbi:MAG: glycoside hydrolase family 3 C-terminal domain-containing protein [Lactobacillus sp.]|nr:glycoside hydrolase family 3 C-terminal domain-containing protein [Lactobacillus sp.]